MEWLLIPVLFLLVGTPSEALPQPDLSRFDRIAREQGRTLVVIDNDGRVRVGSLAAADASGLVLSVADRRVSLAAADIVGVDRDGDSLVDGLVKGALFGALAALPMAGWAESPGAAMLGSAVTYGLIGTVIDWHHRGRTPVYRVRGR